MAAPTRKHPLPVPEAKAEPQSPPPTELTEPNWEQVGHRGDWIGFLVWLAGFLFMALVNFSELIAGLVRR
jgi:hypothetical protein